MGTAGPRPPPHAPPRAPPARGELATAASRTCVGVRGGGGAALPSPPGRAPAGGGGARSLSPRPQPPPRGGDATGSPGPPVAARPHAGKVSLPRPPAEKPPRDGLGPPPPCSAYRLVAPPPPPLLADPRPPARRARRLRGRRPKVTGERPGSGRQIGEGSRPRRQGRPRSAADTRSGCRRPRRLPARFLLAPRPPPPPDVPRLAAPLGGSGPIVRRREGDGSRGRRTPPPGCVTGAGDPRPPRPAAAEPTPQGRLRADKASRKRRRAAGKPPPGRPPPDPLTSRARAAPEASSRRAKWGSITAAGRGGGRKGRREAGETRRGPAVNPRGRTAAGESN